MIKGFSEYLKENKPTSAGVVFGRFNPPHVGHGKLIDKLLQVETNSKFVFASKTHGGKKNPLSYDEKITFMREMFPKASRFIVKEKEIKDLFSVAKFIGSQGYSDLVVVAGSDRVSEYKTRLTKYNEDIYNFNSISVVSCGERNPDDDVSSSSATKARGAVMDNDFESFAMTMPTGYDSTKLFASLKKALNVTDTIKHVRVGDIDPIRESYHNGVAFKVGDPFLTNGGKVSIVSKRHCNYITDINDEKHFITQIKQL